MSKRLEFFGGPRDGESVPASDVPKGWSHDTPVEFRPDGKKGWVHRYKRGRAHWGETALLYQGIVFDPEAT